MTNSDVQKQDPNRPLRNRKHEKFCQVLAKNPGVNQSIAYKEVYPIVYDNSAVTAASRLLSNVNIRDRVLSIMSRDGKDIMEKVSDKVNQHIDGDNAPVSMDACKTVLKISGALDEPDRKADTSYNPVQILINIMPEPIDNKEVRLNDT